MSMKSGLFIAFVLLTTVFTSCKKEEVKPSVDTAVVGAPSTPIAITVEYKIYATSGNFTVTYSAPDASNGHLVAKTETINKMQHSVNFNWMSGNKFKLEASNVSPSTKEVTVEIYINGILYNSALANSPNGIAKAEAIVY